MMDKKELTVIKELCKENQKFAEIYNALITEKCQVLEAANIEFRNRFALIFGNMQLMEANDKSLSENANWMQLADDIKGLHELLEQFTLYITSDKMKSASMNLQILVQEIFQEFHAISIMKEIEMKLEVTKEAEEISKTYVTDYIKLREILMNLVKNAVETVEIGGKITVVMERDEEDTLKISVKNSRSSITDENTQEIFEPKFISKRGKYALELPLCAKFAAMLDGTIQVDSTEQETSFQLCLPIAV